MPLHVDRSSISLNHAHRREWSIERTRPERGATRVADGDPNATPGADVATVSAAPSSTPHPEVAHIEQAEALVRRLVASGSGLTGAQGDVDPARAARLLAE